MYIMWYTHTGVYSSMLLCYKFVYKFVPVYTGTQIIKYEIHRDGANINYTFQFTLPLPPRRRQKNLLQAMLSIEWGVRSTPSQTRRN